MPVWALAKEGSKPDPEVKALFAKLRQKLFGAHGDVA